MRQLSESIGNSPYGKKTLEKTKWRKRKILCMVSGLAAAVFLLSAFVYQNKAEDFSNIITISSDETGFSQSLLDTVRQDDTNTDTFTAWTEKKNQFVTAEINNRTESTSVILLSGASELVIPWGKNLSTEDTDGCIIGESLAKSLFGGSKVEGQKIFYADKLFTVRGVVKEPDNIFLCQFYRDGEVGNADHISLLFFDRTKTRTQTAVNFQNKYGINGQVLHYEHKKNPAYLTELIPGKWSDFSGWEENLKTLRQQEKGMEQCEKTEIESLYLSWIGKRNKSVFWSVVSLTVCAFVLFWQCGQSGGAD